LKALLLTKRYSVSEGDSKWLTDELADYFFEAISDVDVFFMDFDSVGKSSKIVVEGVGVYHFPVGSKKLRAVKLPFKIFMANLFFIIQFRKKYDIVANFSILSVFFPVILFLRLFHKRTPLFSLVWDFFPIHQVEIGRIREGLISSTLFYIENKCLLWSKVIGVMSEEGRNFLKAYHKNLNVETKIIQTPVWGKKLDGVIERQNKFTSMLDSKKVKIAFGGQVGKGRGIDGIVRLFSHNSGLRGSFQLVVAGQGSDLLKDKYGKFFKEGEIVFLPKIPREKYLELLSLCDVGLVSTVSEVTVPTFPSKVIDYMRLGKPVIASVEGSTDFAFHVENTYKCGVAVEAGSDESLINALEYLASSDSLRLELGNNGRLAFERYLDVKIIGQRILDSVT